MNAHHTRRHLPPRQLPRRRPAPGGHRRARRGLVGAVVLAALVTAAATGCGIRPTAVPVDAGGPASRTACPSPVQVPGAVITPSAAPAASTARGNGAPGAKASAARTQTRADTAPQAPPTAPADGLFSALPSPSASGSGRPGCP
ncbi:hypothetical protein [Kitasatospora sp. NBC_00315]|uniref:hypothetical protein n=1 Tax=Kitasatospora sp. NBC_00315 TaxID=2975963 RepID=UPI0032520A0E